MIQYRKIAVIELDINNELYSLTVRPADTLLRVLREKVGLTGAKPGCENGDCGACTVLLDEIPVKSCLILAVEAIGKKITTVEGLKDSAIQNAFLEQGGFQCGYCTSGFLINAHALLENHPDADSNTTREWLESNLCRCTGYEGIGRSVERAKAIIKERRGSDS
ncbi:MAG: (2Fe-2S)-binding protein [Bacillota bacterium]|nr:(2Fe-2S)-binding protein [Bacillota bacterium]